MKVEQTILVFGDILDFIGDPDKLGAQAHRYFSPGALLIQNGKVLEAGDKETIKSKYKTLLVHSKIEIKDFTGQLIIPGLIDTHIHFPQTEMIGAYGEQLLTWLDKHAFPAEQKFQE